MATNVGSATKYFPKAQDGFITTTTGTVTSGASTVPLTSTGSYSNGDVVVMVIDPGVANKQTTFTGLIDTSGIQVTNVVWTAGYTSASHTSGASVVDYVTATHLDLVTTGILKHANQDGSLLTSAVQTALGISNQAANGWNILGITPTYSANNGNKEFVLSTGTDQTGTLSVGMKLQFQRNTTPPTQCMAFSSASSQYASKSSPSGSWPTSAFTIEGWFYILSYAGTQMLISRLDSGAQNGIYLQLDGSGRIVCSYGNAGLCTVTSYASVPLNRWVHIAATATASTKTFTIYLNGVSIPFSLTGSATSIAYGTSSAMIGNFTGATQYLNGYASECRIWSVVQTQANIQANMAINLTGSETNLFALWPGAGNFNDLTANANNLTATNGAIATQASNPYHSTEYGLITGITSTQITIFCGTDYNIPNATLKNFQYSNARVPFGFPAQRGKWIVDTIIRYSYTGIPISGLNSWFASNQQLTVPTGEWTLFYEGNYNQHNSVSGSLGMKTGLSLGGATPTSDTYTFFVSQGSVTDSHTHLYRSTPISLASANYYQMQFYAINSSGTTTAEIRGDLADCIIRAESAYL